jgi:hypothetical protein
MHEQIVTTVVTIAPSKPKRTRLTEADRLEETCAACTKLQKHAKGKKCFECENYSKLDSGLENVGDGEFIIVEKSTGRFCTYKNCTNPLPVGHYYYCPDCHRNYRALEAEQPQMETTGNRHVSRSYTKE